MNIISPDTIYTEVSLADEERSLLKQLLSEHVLRLVEDVDTPWRGFKERVDFIEGIRRKLGI